MSLLQNFLLFQAGWLACVLSAANGKPWIGALFAIAVITRHLLVSDKVANEGLLIVTVIGVGCLWDSLLVMTGLFSFHSGLIAPYLAPWWILVMWGLFATTLNVSLRWLRQDHRLAALLGLVCGPLTYYAGIRLGAAQAPLLGLALMVQAIGWALIMPLLCSLADWCDSQPLRLWQGAR